MGENFQLLGYITIGQYIPTGSVLHRLDPRAKLIESFLIVIAISVANTAVAAWMVLGVIVLLAILGRIPIIYFLRGLRPILPLLVVVSIFQLLFRGQTIASQHVYFEWWFIRITDLSLETIVIGVARVASFIFLASLVTMTTTTTELTHSLEYLLSPFRRLGLPSHELAMVMTIAFRFVPTLTEEIERVMKAQASRGGELAQRSWRPDKIARARLPLIVPLFLSALRRGEDLILAMEARCYVSSGRRTNLTQFRAHAIDAVALIAVVLIVLAAQWLGSRPFG